MPAFFHNAIILFKDTDANFSGWLQTSGLSGNGIAQPSGGFTYSGFNNGEISWIINQAKIAVYQSGVLFTFSSSGGGSAALTSGQVVSGLLATADTVAAIPSGAIASGIVGNVHVCSGGFLSGAYGSGTIGNAQVCSGGFQSGAYGSGTLGNVHVGSGGFGSGAIGSGQVGWPLLGSGGVLSGNIASGQLGTNHYGSGSVVSGTIASGQIGTNHIGGGTQQAAKAWITFGYRTGSLVTDASYNCSVARNATGDYTISFTVSFSSATYAAVWNDFVDRTNTIRGPRWHVLGASQAAGSFRILFTDGVSSAEDKEFVSMAFFGSQ